jgi:type I restriction enzyme S subunit
MELRESSARYLDQTEQRIPKGYKQTEVGVIPEDWSLSDLSSLSAFITKGSTPTTYGFKWEQSGVLFLRSECVSENGLDLSQSMFISEAAHASLRRSEIKYGDILITITGYVGRAILYTNPLEANINQHIARVRIISPQVNNCFIYYVLSHPSYRARFNSITTGQAYPQISLKQVRETKVPLPPTKAEQEAIAEALSDTDAFIESLEQLIAKKRQIKQGAMQELLIGKKRLPGFEVKHGYKHTEVGMIPEDWDFDYIENLARITTGSRNTQDRVDDGQYPFFVRSQTVERINSYSFDGEAVLTAGDGVGTGKVFHYINGKFDVHQRVYRISEFSAKTNGYFFYLYFSSRFYNRIMQMTAKSSVDSVRREMIARMLILLPPTKGEQEAIGTIISDMDAEIAALEAKLAKARRIKQGMMQELLTGRVRLV